MVIPHGFRRFLQVGTIFLGEALQPQSRAIWRILRPFNRPDRSSGRAIRAASFPSHSAGAGCTHGCALRVKKCATGTSHEVSSSVPARRLMVSGRPSRSP